MLFLGGKNMSGAAVRSSRVGCKWKTDEILGGSAKRASHSAEEVHK